MAQGLASGHNLCHVVSSSDAEGGSLDHVMGLAEARHAGSISNATATSSPATASNREEEDDDKVDDKGDTMTLAGNDEKMKIAWRYERMPKLDNASFTPSSVSAQREGGAEQSQRPYHRVFDLTRTYPQHAIQQMAQEGRINIINVKGVVAKTGFEGILAEISRVIEQFR